MKIQIAHNTKDFHSPPIYINKSKESLQDKIQNLQFVSTITFRTLFLWKD